MNKHCFRLVFNRARGCLMAVGEAARAQAKAGRVGSLALMVAAPLLAHGQTVATRIVADPGAPATQRPTVLGTANGVVQVNIQTPSAAGVSRNTYRQFDVGTSGAILNNSRTDTPTQLGGWVQGNPWLARGSARVILSEVNSSDPSRLQGAVEVAGPRADVVIANPSGIVVQGGTFINAAGVTLTTGTPLMRDGVLQGYRVQGGTVRIDGNGLDTQGADYTAILSRALEINAGLWARRLQVVTGANEVASTGLGAESAPQATPIEGTGPAPGFALDSSRLGGMYAGQITLVGTEAGLGVRNAGQVLASAGPLVLSQDGWLSNTGRVQAEAVTIQANSLSNVGGQIIQTGRDDQSITLDGRLDNRGGLIATAAHDFRVSAQAIDNTAGQLLHEGSGSFVLTARDKLDNLADGPGQPAVDGGARILSAGTLRLQAGGIASTGRIGSGADLVLEAGSLSGSASHVMAAGLRGHGALTVTTTGALQSAGQVLAADDVALRGATLDLADGLAGSVAGDIALTATRGDLVTKRARVITPGQLVVTAEAAGQVVDNTQGLLRAKSLLIQAGKVDNTRGRIVAAGDARVTAEALHNGAGLISAKGDLSIDSTGLVDNSAGLVRAGQSLNLRAGRVVNTGTLSFDADGKPKDTGLEGRSVVLTAHQVDNRQGAIRAVQDLALRADGALTNDGGELSAGGVLRITGDTAPAPTLRITNQGGQMVADTRAEVRAATLGGAGTLASQGDVVLQLQGDHTLAGTLQAGGDLQIDVAGRLTNPVVVQAGRNLTANAAALDNQATGELTSALATRLKVAGAFTNRGLVDGADTRIEAATVDNVGTGRLYGDRMALAANAFTNREEAAGGSVRAATLAGRERVDIGVAHLTNRENALIYSGGDMAIGGALDASGRTTGRAQSVHNQSATIDAARDLGIDAVAIHNTNAHFATEVRLVSQSAVTEFQHRRGDVISTRDTSTRFSDREAGVEWCEASCLRSPAGTSDAYIRYDYTRTVTESAIVQSAPGRILAGRDMHLAAGTLYNDKSHIVAGGAIESGGSRLDNVDGLGQRTTSQVGTATEYWRVRLDGHDTFGSRPAPYAPAPVVETVHLKALRFERHAAGASTGHTPAATAVSPAPGKAARSGGAVLDANGTGDPLPAMQIRTIAAPLQLPTASLFTTRPESSARYLVETDPRFTQYKAWIGSDYLMQALRVDPAAFGKRMGDAFYEQTLVREQVLALTGQRFVGDYRDDDSQFRALMDAGLSYARQWDLRPGIALSPEQVAQLTSDMVWLVTREVTLPDGSRQSVLVPQVYVRVRPGDIDGTGALIAGRDVSITLSGDARNSGTIAGRNLVRINAAGIDNQNGAMAADILDLKAALDIDNTGGRLQAHRAMRLDAGRDLKVVTTTAESASAAGGNAFTRTGVDRMAGLYITGPAGELLAKAGRDIDLTAAQVQNDGTGVTSFQAGRNVNLGTATTGESQDIQWDGSNYVRQSGSREAGTQIATGGTLTFQAGGDVNARAADVKAGGALRVDAEGSVNITAGQSSQALDAASQHTSRSMLSSRTLRTAESSASTTAQGSGFEGRQVDIRAGQDIRIQGSAVVADQDVTLHAAGNVAIKAAQDTRSQSVEREDTKRGLFRGEGASFTLGRQSLAQGTQIQGTTAVASTLGSVGGGVSITAGKRYTQTGSDIATPAGDVNIEAQSVTIDEAREATHQRSDQRFSQSGVTVALTSPVVSAAQGVEQQASAASHTRSSRMQALAAANAAMQVKDGVGQAQAALAQGDVTGGVGISVSVGASSSRSTQQIDADTARGSTVHAGGNVRIRATGAGQDGNVTIQGGDVRAGGTTTLQADNRVDMLASKNTTEESSSERSRSASVGVGVRFGGQGSQAGVTVSASGSNGEGAGRSTSYSNTDVAGGQRVVIDSGGDTTLRGATVSGRQISARVGGDLTIESLQDTSRYGEQSHSAGGSVTVGPASGGSVALGRTRIDSHSTSVGEQSALRAGDSGFDVKVEGHNTLVGGQITSSERAVQHGANRYASAGGTTTRNLQNTAGYSAQSVSVGLGTGRPAPGAALSAGLSGVGVGSDRGSASSTTTAGISGVAGDKAARTGDPESGLKPIFNREQVRGEVNAQVVITQEFGKRASQAVGDYASARVEEARRNGDAAGVEAWREGGAARVALHVAVGGLTGGVQGAAGAGAASAAAPVIEQLQSQLQDGLQRAGLDPKASQGIARLVGGGAAAALGAAAGGGSTAGAAAAFNADMNNRQLHPSEVQRARELAARSGGKYTQAQIEEQMRLMGNAVTGEQPNTTTVVTTTEAIATSVQSDPGMPRTVQGPVVVEVPGRADSELQAWIVENTTQGSGYIPGQSPYTASNPALNGPVRTTGRIDAPTAATANNDLAGRSGIGVQQNAPLSQQAREAIADGASTLSRQAGVVSSGATAAMAGLPPQGRPIAGALAIGAGATGIAADVVEQVVRPNLGAAVADGAGTVVEGLVNRIPGARSIAPITNEVIELWRSSGSARSLQDWVNDQFKGDKP